MKSFESMSFRFDLDCLVQDYNRGEIDANPSYQRGLVWGVERKRKLIYSLCARVPVPALIFNDRLIAGMPGAKCQYAVIDGKQRLNAIVSFVSGEYSVPVSWFGAECSRMVFFKDLPVINRRRFLRLPIDVVVGRLPTVHDEIYVFDLVNFCGVAFGSSDFI